MILSVWRPVSKSINKKQVIIYYTLVDIDDIYNTGSSNLRVIYTCDSETCEKKNEIRSISRHHLSEKRSKTLNEKIQICKSCQMMGEKNPKWKDNRKWEEIYDKEKCNELKMLMSKRMTENNPSKNQSTKEKKIQTNLKNWGVENVFQNEEIKEKIRDSIFEKWGVFSFTKTEAYKEKSIKTNLDKYGVEHPMKLDEVKEKAKSTNIKKYGFVSHTKTEEYKSKRKDHTITEEYRKNRFAITREDGYVKYLGNSISLFNCEMGHQFEIKSDSYHGRKTSGINFCTICNPIGDNRSIKQSEVYDFIDANYCGEIIQSYRDKLEIDIYLPDLNIGFEFNGLYWHSDYRRDKKYHINKTDYFYKKGIRIFHIWEDDWHYKRDIIKSMILNILNCNSNRIFARECEIHEIEDVKESIRFLNDNHIQGKSGSNIKIGLYYKGELVSLMTFDKNEGRKKMNINEWNLSRFCSKLNTSVIGGASKMFKFFLKKYKPYRIITYADKSYSTGDLYIKLGFEKVSYLPEDYKYFIGGKRVNKSFFRKSNLDTNLSESEYMIKNKIYRIWDSGKIKFELFCEK